MTSQNTTDMTTALPAPVWQWVRAMDTVQQAADIIRPAVDSTFTGLNCPQTKDWVEATDSFVNDVILRLAEENNPYDAVDFATVWFEEFPEMDALFNEHDIEERLAQAITEALFKACPKTA